jgi:hypothetical protein
MEVKSTSQFKIENVRLRKFLKRRNILLDSKSNFGAYVYKKSTEDFILNNGHSLVCVLLQSMETWQNKTMKVFRKKRD